MNVWIFLAGILPGAAFLWFGVPMLVRRAQQRSLARLCAEQRAIVLTYDDGPTEGLTGDLADYLSAQGVAATFFVIGANAMQRPEILRAIVDQGHEIGTHTLTHSNAWKAAPGRAVRDMLEGVRHVARLGAPSTLFRPPFGKATLLTLLVGWRQRLRFAYWTHDSQDSWNRLPVETVLERLERDRGGVVLMHDFPWPRRGPAPERHIDHVRDLTTRLVGFGKEKGFVFMTFGQLVGAAGHDQRGAGQ